MDWVEIRNNYPQTFKEFMKTNFSLEDFFDAYSIYVGIRILENKSGEEFWDFKLESKLVIYSSLCSKTIIRNGEKITIYSGSQMKMKIVDNVFKVIEEQIKDNNYIQN
jgi:hypothetical protein|tara:strand:- start:2938 stop:3261 length:324 start_codon:yes stop_codon:yes gene_type:complete